MLRSLLLTHHLTPLQAIAYAMLAYLMFSLSDGFAKYLMDEGYARAFILVMTSLPSWAILTTLMIKRRGLKQAYYTPYKTLHIGRVCGLIGVTFFGFWGLQKLPLADFYGIVFSTPLMMTLGAFLFFKERVTLTEAIIIMIGFSGTLIVAQPDINGFNIGYLYAFLAVICVTAGGMCIRKMGSGEDAYLYVVFANVGIILANIVPAIQSNIPDTIAVQHVIAYLLYCFTIPTATLTISAVFARAPSIATVAPFQYTQIIWGSLFGYFVFGDIPQSNVIIGSGIVIACGLYILFYHKRKKKRDLIK